MDLYKITTSGQVTLPRVLRKNFGTDYFSAELIDGGILFRPVYVRRPAHPDPKPHKKKDLKGFHFKANPSDDAT